MNLTLFKECLKNHKEYYEKLDKIIIALDISDHIEIGDKLSDSLINVLQDSFQDKSDWVYYWVFELNYGADYVPGSVIIDNKNVELKTEEDLYNLLMENKNANAN